MASPPARYSVVKSGFTLTPSRVISFTSYVYFRYTLVLHLFRTHLVRGVNITETIRPRARPSPSKTTSPPGPHWLTDDDEFVRQSQKRSFDQFASGGSGSSGMRAARMTAVAMTGAPRSNTSASKINIREKFPQLRDAEMAPGGVLKILDGGETEDTATERVEALRG